MAFKVIRRALKRYRDTTKRKRLALFEDNGAIVLKSDWVRPGWTPTALVLKSRWDTRKLILAVDCNNIGFSARILATDIIDKLGADAGFVDLYIQFSRIQRNQKSGKSDSGAKRKQTTSIRVGRFIETLRENNCLSISVGECLIRTHITSKDNLSLIVGNSAPEQRAIIRTNRIQHSRGCIAVNFDVAHSYYRFHSARLIVTGRETKSKIAFPVRISYTPKASEKNHGWITHKVSGAIPDEKLAAWLLQDETTLDLTLEFDIEGGGTHACRIPAPKSGYFLRRLRVFALRQRETAFQFVPYQTFRYHNLSYRIETFKPDCLRLLNLMKWLGWIGPLVSPFTRVWMIGELPYKAQDNGYYFFRYVREEHPKQRVFYVINANSPDRAKVERLGNVVFQNSRKHILLSLLATRLVASHHAEYLLPTRDKRFTRWILGIRVFLQHGPTAQKNVTLNYGRQVSQERPTELFLVTSDLEKKIIVEDYGYKPYQVPVVGFARFDSLFTQDVAKKPTVLVMPTWRDYITSEDEFLESDYFHKWRGLLLDDAFRDVLRQFGLELTFVLHPNMRRFAEHFDLENVNLVRQEDIDVQWLIKQSAVLITDFSSVAWDFSYLDRPVLYFQFDRQRLIGERQPHIDFETSLPGPIGRTFDDMTGNLEQAIQNKLEIAPEYKKRSRAFLKYKDQSNCYRIYDTVRAVRISTIVIERIRNTMLSQALWSQFRYGTMYEPIMRTFSWLARQLPRKEVVVFDSDRGNSFGDAPRYIYERLIQRDHGLKIVWASNTTIRFPDPDTEKVKRYSPRYWWLASRARYWVSNQNMPNALRKPSGTKFLQTWHGTPLKRMQHDVVEMKGRDAAYEQRAKRLTSYWDTLLSASPYATKAFRSAFRFHGEILELGYPRNDLFFWPDRHDRVENAKSRISIANDRRKIVLYAPTFRDDNRQGRWWKHDLKLDIDMFVKELSKDYILLTRFHPLVRNPLPVEYRQSRDVLDVSSYPDIQELLLMSDILVTDYSSLFFDFSTLQRPIIFYPYDLEHYRDELRGFYLDYEAQVPGPIVRSTQDLIRAIREAENPSKEYLRRLSDFKKTFCPHDDGKASDRVIEEFFRLPGKR